MRKGVKIWLIIAGALVVFGIVLLAVAMSFYNWDFSKLSTGKFETHTYDINEKFTDIDIKTETADIDFVSSDNGNCKVIFETYEKEKYSADVKNGVLNIKTADERKWYDHIGIFFRSPKVTVYLPEKEYDSLLINESTGDIKIPKDFKFTNADISLSTGDISFFASASETVKFKTTTGDVKAEKFSADTLDISVTTGEIYLSDIMCKNLTTNGSTGDVLLKKVIASEKMSIERSTGNVRIENSDAAEIFVKTATGDVSGKLMTDKVFITETSTGSVKVPKTVLSGGKCEIITSTGDITFE